MELLEHERKHLVIYQKESPLTNSGTRGLSLVQNYILEELFFFSLSNQINKGTTSEIIPN
tara:strand:- start:330 stop:509 length:180 start_codon:yes stop_codon:yes gene_type:complete